MSNLADIEMNDPISLEPFERPTRLLPCGHTLNHTSLASLILSNEDDPMLACPVCRKRSATKPIEEYPRNYVLEQQIECNSKIKQDAHEQKMKAKILVSQHRKKELSQTHGKNSIQVLECTRQLADIYNDMAEYDKAIQCYEEVISQATPSNLGYAVIAQVYCAVGNIYEQKGQYKKGLHYLNNALKIQLKEYQTTDHVDIAASYNNIAIIHCKQKRYTVALQWYTKSLNICKKQSGNTHPHVLNTYNNIATVYYLQNKYTEAIKLYNKVIACYESNKLTVDSCIAASYNGLANIYAAQQNVSDALHYYQLAMKIGLGIHGENHPAIANSYHNIASIHLINGNPNMAKEYYRKALHIKLDRLGNNHPNLTSTYEELAKVYEETGENMRAIKTRIALTDLKKTLLGNKNPTLSTSYIKIAEAYKVEDDYNGALKYYNLAYSVQVDQGKPRPCLNKTLENINTCNKKLNTK